MGEITSTENADAYQQAAEGGRQGFESEQERARGLGGGRSLPNEQPKRRNSDQSRQECPEKHFAVGVAGGDAFDGAQPAGTCTDGRQKRGQHGRGGFVAPVTKQAGEPDADDSTVEP